MSFIKQVKRKSLLLVIVLAFLLVLCSTATAKRVMYVHSSPFNDVSTNHWSIQNIVKMNIRGVVSGYTDGSFQPDKAVTQIEAILMAVRNMEASTEISRINENDYLPVSVPDWAKNKYKKELLYAIDRGLIVPAENNFNASSYASRAWMAQLIVRMINKESETTHLSSHTTSFADDSSIPIWASAYVNIAVKYELISGYPDNTFKPYNNISRAETVALLNRCESHLNLKNNISKGKISSISNDNFTLLSNGKYCSVLMDLDTWAFDENNHISSWTNLNEGDVINVILHGNKAKYLEKLEPEAIIQSFTATILHVLPEENLVVVKDEDGKILTRTVDISTNISSENGSIYLLSEMAAGNEVEIGMDEKGNLKSIILLNANSNLSCTGIIFDINYEQNLLVMKNTAGKFASYQYDDNIEVVISGQRFADIEDLKTGDEIKVSVQSGTLSKVELVQEKQQLEISAKIALISNEKKLLTLEKDGKVDSYYVSSDAEINIRGIAQPAFADLMINDEVDLEISEGKIVSITVNNRSAENTSSGTVKAIDKTNKVLVLTDSDNKLQSYEFNDVAQIIVYDDDDADIDDLKKDMEVEFQLLNDKIIYLEANNSIKGTVVSLKEEHHLISLLLSNGETRTYVLASGCDVDIEDVGSPDLDDVDKNDYVELRIEKDLVKDIKVQRTYTYRVYSIYESSEKLKVKDEDNDNKYLYLRNHVDLIIPGVSSPDVEDFSKDDIIRATYVGNTLKKVELSYQVCGEITSISSYSDTVKVHLFNGNEKSCVFSRNSQVIDGSHKSSSLSSLDIGDRVELIEDTGGSISFKLMKTVSGKFVNIDDRDEKIYISKNSSYSYSKYNIAEDCYIHRDSRILRLRDLEKNDDLTLYVIDKLVYEIEKD